MSSLRDLCTGFIWGYGYAIPSGFVTGFLFGVMGISFVRGCDRISFGVMGISFVRGCDRISFGVMGISFLRDCDRISSGIMSMSSFPFGIVREELSNFFLMVLLGCFFLNLCF